LLDTQRSRATEHPPWIGESRPSKAATRVTRTLEVRWLHPGRIPDTMLERFGPFLEPIEERADRYLVEPSLPELGVKIKGDVQLDLKVYRGSPGELLFPGVAAGRLEIWEKSTVPLDAADLPPDGATGWLTIRKARRRRTFLLADELIERPLSEIEAPGCAIELSEVGIGDEVWWTLGFEAGGPSETLDRDLYATAELLLSRPLPDGRELDLRDSMSYARWIGARRVHN
jgi:hypothetical protein